MNQRLTGSSPASEPDDELVAALVAVETYLAEEQAALTQAQTPAPEEARPSWRASAKLAAIGLRPARVPPLRWHTVERYRRSSSGMTGVIGV